MRTGWLIYDEQGARRNEWFISSFLQTAERYGVKLTLKLVEEDFLSEPLPSFVIVRTIAPQINKFLRERSVPVFNNYQTAKIANDKWLTYTLCEELGIPTMKTQPLSFPLSLPFPLVLKSRNGHGGSEVFLAENSEALEGLLPTMDVNNFIAQEFCSSPGKDMRVYVLGGEVICGMLRQSEKDFRSNFSLGGNASVCEVSKAQKEIIAKLYAALGCDFVGVDFILHNGQWILNEIEDVVGTRMLYAHTKLDIVDLYLKYILKKLA